MSRNEFCRPDDHRATDDEELATGPRSVVGAVGTLPLGLEGISDYPKRATTNCNAPSSGKRARFQLDDGQLPTDQQLDVSVVDDQNRVDERGFPIAVSAGVT